MDPKQLMALVAREKGMKPMGGMGEEAMPEEELPPVEGEGGEEASGEEDFIELTEREIEDIANMVEDGDGLDDLYELAEEFVEAMETAEEEGEEFENPPKWAASPSIWDKAEAAVDPEGKGSKYKEPYAVTVHVYRRMGGKIK